MKNSRRPICNASLAAAPFYISSFFLLHFPMNDLKFAFRQLLKNPGFTVQPSRCRYGGQAVAVLTVGPVLRVSVREYP